MQLLRSTFEPTFSSRSQNVRASREAAHGKRVIGNVEMLFTDMRERRTLSPTLPMIRWRLICVGDGRWRHKNLHQILNGQNSKKFYLEESSCENDTTSLNPLHLNPWTCSRGQQRARPWNQKAAISSEMKWSQCWGHNCESTGTRAPNQWKTCSGNWPSGSCITSTCPTIREAPSVESEEHSLKRRQHTGLQEVRGCIQNTCPRDKLASALWRTTCMQWPALWTLAHETSWQAILYFFHF